MVLNKRVIIALVFLSVFSAIWTFADTLRMSSDDHQAISQTGTFVTKYKTNSIPPAVQEAFSKETQDVKFSMANPGEKWQATDVISEHGLPWRRLIFVSISNTHCLIHYEKGGRAHSFYLVLFRLENGRARLVWRAAVKRELKGIEEVNTAIQKGIVDDNPAFYF